jgi:arylsulfatase A-like enzyme
MRRHPERIGPDDVRHIEARYKGEVSYMDRYVGWMLDRLDEVQLERPTLIVFASDHGEEFWEHRSVGHGHTVYEELLRIPLMMKLEGVLPAGRRVQADVTLADLTPTILDLLGIAIPESMHGESLLPLVTAPNDDRPQRAGFARGNREQAVESVSFGRFKLIRTAGAHPPRLALYDLAEDPGESRDRAAELPIVTATLSQLLRWNQHRDSLRPKTAESKVGPDELDPETIRRLREIGYVE